MASDPRSHISVGIDGRQYARPNPVYIDVLGLPTITEAVHAASDMLRRGIIHAMSTAPPEKSNPPSKSDKPDRQNPQTTSNTRSQTPSQTTNTSAGRDPFSVYSAVTKRSRKNAPDTDPTSNINPENSPVLIVKEKINTEPQTSTSTLWSSAKKAGPSILSKRNRTQSAASASASGGERVFQPSSKRERRSETANETSTRTSSQSTATVISNPSSATTSTASISRTRQPFVRNGPSKAATTKPPDVSNKPLTNAPSTANITPETLPPVPTKKPTQTSSASKTSQTLSLAPKGILKKSTTSAPKPHSKSVLKPLSLGSLPTSKPQPNAAVRSPGAAKLPSAWSQVPGKSSKGFTTNSSGLQGNSLLRKPVAGLLFPKTTFSLGSSTARDTNPTPSSTAQGLPVRKRSSQLAVRPASTPTSSESVIPLPSSSDLQVKHVPGSEIIRGVRPNGYTVSREGVVKPVVTFSPKPKLPHKLRQTSVEKLFEGYRDIKKLAEADALARALREEQEMYADAKGRVEYRAAVTVRLKEVRK